MNLRVEITSESLVDPLVSKIASTTPRDIFRVGVSKGFLGLSELDSTSGEWVGFDVDIARAVAIALFGSDQVIEFVPLASAERFTALDSGRIDLGCFNSTVTASRELVEGVLFGPPTLHDGEVFATRISNLISVDSLTFDNLLSRRVAVLDGSTTLVNVQLYSDECGVDFSPVFYTIPSEALAGYKNGEADVICLDSILLAGELSRLGELGHVLLEDQVTLEPMAPAVSASRPDLATVVRWVVYALIEAERLGVTKNSLSTGVSQCDESDEYLSQFLDGEHWKGKKSALRPGFVREVIGAVGNYADIFCRNLGTGSTLKVDRRRNQLVEFGGLLTAPRFI